MKTTITAVIFDMDGVLFDTERDVDGVLERSGGAQGP